MDDRGGRACRDLHRRIARADRGGRIAAWEILVSVAAVAAASLAVWLTARADFLAHPGWLAFQKADVILGPVGIGLYWHRCRPASRFGPLLIAFGFVGVPYILQSSSHSALFSVGASAAYSWSRQSRPRECARAEEAEDAEPAPTQRRTQREARHRELCGRAAPVRVHHRGNRRPHSRKPRNGAWGMLRGIFLISVLRVTTTGT